MEYFFNWHVCEQAFAVKTHKTAFRYFRYKKKGCLKDKISKLAMNSDNKNI
jgi:hypothetical protein